MAGFSGVHRGIALVMAASVGADSRGNGKQSWRINNTSCTIPVRPHGLTAFGSSKHLEYAAAYIFCQSQNDGKNPHGVGTGGTPFMPYLTKYRDETALHRLP
jgi:hypothetical protein